MPSIILQIENWKEKGSDDWKEEHWYQFGEQLYELFAEARAVEMSETTRPKPRSI